MSKSDTLDSHFIGNKKRKEKKADKKWSRYNIIRLFTVCQIDF
jgi:hypothetical protein